MDAAHKVGAREPFAAELSHSDWNSELGDPRVPERSPSVLTSCCFESFIFINREAARFLILETNEYAAIIIRV